MTIEPSQSDDFIGDYLEKSFGASDGMREPAASSSVDAVADNTTTPVPDPLSKSRSQAEPSLIGNNQEPKPDGRKQPKKQRESLNTRENGAGVDTSKIEEWTGKSLAEYMVAVRVKRHNDRAPRLAAQSGQQDDDGVGALGSIIDDDESTLMDEEENDSTTEDSADGDTPMEEDTIPMNDDTTLTDEGNREDMLPGLNPPRKERKGNQNRKTWSKGVGKMPLSLSDEPDFKFGCKQPTLSVETVRSYLLAIKNQARVDADYTVDADHRIIPGSDINASDAYIPAKREVILYGDDGNVLFSHHVQKLVRSIMEHRATLRLLRSEEASGAIRANAELARHSHCGYLIGVLTDYLEDWNVNGKVEATKLVNDMLC